MTKKELLEAYRARVIELEEVQRQLARVGTDGRPSGIRAPQYDRISRGTNDPSAAAAHLAEGLEALARRKEEELMMLAGPVDAILGQIEDLRTYMVVQRYYMMAETDEQIAYELSITRQRANQVRRDFLNAT